MNSSSAAFLNPDRTFVVLGRVGRPHGVRGWLNVDLVGDHLREFVGSPVGLASGQLVPILHDPAIKNTLPLKGAQPEHGTVKHIAFEGVGDRETAAQFTNLLLVLPLTLMRTRARAQRTSSVVPLHELWYFEIYGLLVRDAENLEPIGHIAAVEDLGRNTVIAIAMHHSSAQVAPLEVPLDYPHWGKADLDRREILLAEWRLFLGD